MWGIWRFLSSIMVKKIVVWTYAYLISYASVFSLFIIYVNSQKLEKKKLSIFTFDSVQIIHSYIFSWKITAH